jgi:hypothetical protein
VASSEAQDVLHWAMRPTSYRRIHMVIKITSTSLHFLLSLIPLSPTTVDKDQDSHNKLKPSCHIVIIDVIDLLVYYGHPQTTMHAIFATILTAGE